MYSAGIYLGIDFVDVVILESAKGKIKIVKSIRNLVSEDAAQAGKGNSIELIAAAVKKSFSGQVLKTKAVNFAIPQEEIMIRRFKVPYIPEEERLNAVKFEAQKYIPFRVDDTISDFYIVSESKGEKGMDAFFIAVNKQAMEKYAALFKDLKVKLSIVDIIPVALLRVISMCKVITKEESAALVYVEKNMRGSVLIIKDESPYLTREVNLPASKEAFFENILSNLKLSVDYFKRETKEAGVGRIIIYGDVDLTELETYLKENLPDAKIQILQIEESKMEGLNELSKKQIIAIGLAMASCEKPRPKINLAARFPQMAAAKDISQYKPLIIEGVAIIVILGMLQFFMNSSLAAAKKQMEQVRSQKPAVRGLASEDDIATLEAQEKKFRDRKQFMESLVGRHRLFLTKKLNALGRFLPEGAWIESFQFNDEVNKSRELKIEGFIYSKDGNETLIANRMLADMKGSEDFYFGFTDIKLLDLKKTSAYEKMLLSFSLNCTGQPLKMPEAASKGATPGPEAAA